MATNITQKTIRGLFWASSGSIVQSVLRILVVAILARLISPADFGIIGAATIVTSTLSDFYQIGIGPAIIQIKDLRRAHITTGFTVSIVLSIAFSLLLVAAASLVADFFRMPGLINVIRILALIIPIQGISIVGLSLLNRELQFRTIAIFNTISYLIGFGLIGVILAILGFGKWAIVAAQLAQALCSTILILFSSKFPKEFNIEKAAFKEMMYLAGGMSLSRIGNRLALQGDYLVVGRQLGDIALGYYSRAYQLMILPVTLFGQALDSVLFASMAKYQTKHEQLANSLQRGTGTLSLLTLPTMAASIVIAPELFFVLFGPNWQEAVLPFQILTLGMFFRSAYKISDAVARATGTVYKRAWIQWLYAALVILGAFIGKERGLEGVALGVLIAISINFILMSTLSLRITGLQKKHFLKASLSGIKASLLILIVCWPIITILREFNISPIISLVITACAGLGSLLTFMYYQPEFLVGNDGMWLVKKIGESIPEDWLNKPFVKNLIRRRK